MRTAIVTGVSRGLGEALAVVLLARGWSVMGVGRGSSARLGGDRYRFVRCDFEDVAGMEAALAAPFAAVAAAESVGRVPRQQRRGRGADRRGGHARCRRTSCTRSR